MIENLVADVPLSGDEWLDNAEVLLSQALTETASLRRVGPLPEISHGPVAAVSALQDVRSRLDRVEELLTRVLRFRTGVRVLFKKASTEVDDSWNAAIVGPRSGPGRSRSEFGFGESAPRERYAKADTAVLDQRILARRRERILDACNDAVEQLKLAHRGLDSVRMDLSSISRASANLNSNEFVN